MLHPVRPMRPDEYPLLTEFLYHAIFVPEGEAPPPREIVERPELQVYVAGFGSQKDDIAFVAEAGGRVVGAVWVRDMPDYGHVAAGVPSFAIALLPEARGQGLGTALMDAMLAELRARGFARCSLAVQKRNRAQRLYRRAGFVTLRGTDEEFIMVCDLRK